MKTTITILFFLITTCVYAQNEKALVKFCPLALVDPVMPTIQAGIEFKLSNKITWYNELGIKYIKSIIEQYSDTSFVASNGFKVKSEIRYYFKKKEQLKFTGHYFATNIFFTQGGYNRSVTYTQNGNSTILTDNFGVKKNLFGLNAVFGNQKRISKNILLDAYVGIGIRLVHLNTVSQQYNKNTGSLISGTDPKIYYIQQKEDANNGASITLNITGGFRICFKL